MTDAERTARIFSKFLAKEIGAENFAEVIRRNNHEANPSVCHSHDFCDANMTMAAALYEVVGRPDDMLTEEDMTLWTDAWDLAKVRDFFHASHAPVEAAITMATRPDGGPAYGMVRATCATCGATKLYVGHTTASHRLTARGTYAVMCNGGTLTRKAV